MSQPVLVVGESLVDVVVRDGVESVHPGGSPLNVAVGLRRLGMSATLHSRFGRDDNGMVIAAHLAANGVAVTEGTVGSIPTSAARAAIAVDGSAEYDFTVAWDPVPIDLRATSWGAVHVGSIGSWMLPGAVLVEDALRSARPAGVVTFDPNIRPALMPSRREAVERIERLVALADVVKASDEDLEWLYPGSDPLEVLQRWLQSGPALVIVTRGADGADSMSHAGVLHSPARTVSVVDTIGAGDSFMAALIAALDEHEMLGAAGRGGLRGLDLPTQSELVEFAVRCAAVTATRAGADPPTRADLAS